MPRGRRHSSSHSSILFGAAAVRQLYILLMLLKFLSQTFPLGPQGMGFGHLAVPLRPSGQWLGPFYLALCYMEYMRLHLSRSKVITRKGKETAILSNSVPCGATDATESP